MYHINEIELFFEPRQIILPKLDGLDGEPEMTEFESAFLCGLIKKYRPRKVVEVGIAGGGTTAIIMQCMSMISTCDSTTSEVFGCDIAEKMYVKENAKTGYIAHQASEFIDNVKLHLCLGRTLAESIDEIGDGIDLILLDTVHFLPGEVLDVLVSMPYLSDDAIIVFHDLITCQASQLGVSSIATPVAFHSLDAEKFMNFKPCTDWGIDSELPNIGAAIMNNNAKRSMGNLISILSIPWYYMPSDKEMSAYLAHIRENYSETEFKLFEESIRINRSRMKNESLKNRLKLSIKALARGKV